MLNLRMSGDFGKSAAGLLLLLMISVPPGISSDASLFRSDNVPEPVPASSLVFLNAGRLRPVALSPQVTTPGMLAEGDILALNLFPGVVYTARIDRTNVNVNGTLTIRGRIEGWPFGYVLISTTGGRSLGSIRIPERGEQYIIQSEPEAFTHYLLEPLADLMDEVQIGPPLIPPDPEGPEIAEIGRIRGEIRESGPLDPAQIDVMIVYTPAARSWADASGGGIANVVAQAMGFAQLGLDNSNTLLTMSLVHSGEVNYTESGSSYTDLDRLTFHAGYDPWNRDPDRHMDEVQTWRDQYGADLVALFAFVNDVGGLGWLLSSTAGRPHFGYSLTRVQQAGWTYTHIHELGHNMGCHHHKEQNVQPGPGLFDFSAGWRWVGNDNGRYCSIMTYTSGSYFADGLTHSRVAHFSNPGVLHQGVLTGHGADGDNARTIREVKHAVAAYRDKCGIPSSITVPASSDTGSYTVSWGASSTPGVTYILEEATNTGFTNNLRVAYIGTETGASITGRSSGNTYYYRVKATRSGYADSNWQTGSNGCIVTMVAAPPTPASITYPTSSTTGNFTVIWAASTGATSYLLQRSTDGGTTWTGIYTGAGLSHAETVPNGAYRYRVRATNVVGSSAWRTGTFDCVVDIVSPVIGLNRTRLNFGAVIGGQRTRAQQVVISNTGGGTLNWTAAANSWIGVSPASGTGMGVVTVSVDETGLSAGAYTSLVTFTAAGASNSPQAVQVTLNVYAPGTSSPPFGFFDTPTAGATVYGAVPVTGWALDDVEVVRVEIKRSPHPNDPPVVIGPDGLVYIGDAIFSEGSRPDVEGIYPNYPLSYRAGWGYHLLTNTLPDRGNGPFTLHAFAHDREGTRVKLGQKTVTGDNLNSKRPFGTIDTPAQGGTASGDRFMNAGWVLTPLPNMMPPDGSTMMVYVSGVPLGRPEYNLYRADIAGLFPEYANADGALGVFFIDTTVLENRVHTIAWGVADNAGNAEGIGSRYFTVQNLGGGDAVAAGGDAAVSGVRRITDLAGTVVKTAEPVYVVTGYNPRRMPEMVRPGPDGVVEIAILEVERVEVVMGVEAMDRAVRSGRWSGRGEYPKPHPSSYEPSDPSSEEAIRSGLFSGYLVVGDELRPLPIGSTLDSRTGIFAWQPGPGFLGEYTFVFVRVSRRGVQDKTLLRITIKPKF